MQDNYVVAGKGLQLMFWGTIVTVVGGLIPLFGGVVAIGGGLVVLYGLFTAMNAHENYQMAMYMAIADIIVNILSSFLGDGVLGVVLSLASSVVSFLEVYYFCTASAALLSAKGDEAQADKANLIITLNFVCAALAVVCVLVAWIPVVNILAGVAAVVGVIVVIVALVLRLIFYYKASQSLLA